MFRSNLQTGASTEIVLYLVPLLLNLQCWVAPRSFALGPAGVAFDANGALVQPAHVTGVQAVVDQVLWAAACLGPAAT